MAAKINASRGRKSVKCCQRIEQKKAIGFGNKEISRTMTRGIWMELRFEKVYEKMKSESEDGKTKRALLKVML